VIQDRNRNQDATQRNAPGCHVVSPFPAKLFRDGVLIEGVPESVSFQLLINGSQVIDVQGNKDDRIFVPLK
jgi:hypothetical protein